jgi:3-methylcrotonyl-CoA carboxylase alpha subunit
VEGGDPSVITAPIAGTVQKILVSPGESVDAKAPVILLDAMKMDTYVYAPQAGRVAEVLTSAGATVQVGDRLLRVQPEG